MAELLLQWQEGETQRSERIASQAPDPARANAPTVKIGRDPQQCDIVLIDDTVANLHVEIACDAATDRCYLRWSPPEKLYDAFPTPHPIVNGQALKTDAIVLDTMNTLQLGQVLLNIAVKARPEPAVEVKAMGPYCPLPKPSKTSRKPAAQKLTQPLPPPALVGLVLVLLLSLVTMGSVFMVIAPRKLKYVDVPLKNYNPNRLPAVESEPTPQPSPAPRAAPTLTLDQLTELTKVQLADQKAELVALSCPQSSDIAVGQTLECEVTVADAPPFQVELMPTSPEQVRLKPEAGIFFAKDVEQRIQHWMQAQFQLAGEVTCDRTIILDYRDQQFTCQAQTPSGPSTVLTHVDGYDLTFEFDQPVEVDPLVDDPEQEQDSWEPESSG